MDNNTLRSMLTIGETVAVEFKRCGNGIEHDTYESVLVREYVFCLNIVNIILVKSQSLLKEMCLKLLYL